MSNPGAALTRFYNKLIQFWSETIWPWVKNNINTNAPLLWPWIKTHINTCTLLLTAVCTVAGFPLAFVIWTYTKDTAKLAKWTAQKDFIEFCADETTQTIAVDCARAENVSLPGPPGFFNKVARSLGAQLAQLRTTTRSADSKIPWAVIQNQWHDSLRPNKRMAAIIGVAMTITIVVGVVFIARRNTDNSPNLPTYYQDTIAMGQGAVQAGEMVEPEEPERQEPSPIHTSPDYSIDRSKVGHAYCNIEVEDAGDARMGDIIVNTISDTIGNVGHAYHNIAVEDRAIVVTGNTGITRGRNFDALWRRRDG